MIFSVFSKEIIHASKTKKLCTNVNMSIIQNNNGRDNSNIQQFRNELIQQNNTPHNVTLSNKNWTVMTDTTSKILKDLLCLGNKTKYDWIHVKDPKKKSDSCSCLHLDEVWRWWGRWWIYIPFGLIFASCNLRWHSECRQ